MIHRNMNEKYSPKKILNAIQIRLDLKIVRLQSPDRPNPGGPDSKYFIGPLKSNLLTNIQKIKKIDTCFKFQRVVLSLSP